MFALLLKLSSLLLSMITHYNTQIPKGIYCYDKNGLCPYWDRFSHIEDKQNNGYCHFLGKGDWEPEPDG